MKMRAVASPREPKSNKLRQQIVVRLEVHRDGVPGQWALQEIALIKRHGFDYHDVNNVMKSMLAETSGNSSPPRISGSASLIFALFSLSLPYLPHVGVT